jgi:hypothetical protein
MRLKIVNILTVCLITLAVLSPELVVFNAVWEQHTELVERRHLACELNSSRVQKLSLSPKHQVKSSYRDTKRSNIFNADSFEKITSTDEQYDVVDILQWFVLLIPIILGILAFLYDRYLIYRAAIFQRQVEMLERLWQQSIEQ